MVAFKKRRLLCVICLSHDVCFSGSYVTSNTHKSVLSYQCNPAGTFSFPTKENRTTIVSPFHSNVSVLYKIIFNMKHFPPQYKASYMHHITLSFDVCFWHCDAILTPACISLQISDLETRPYFTRD